MSNPFDIIMQELTEIKQTISVIKTSPEQQVEIIDRPELIKRLKISEPTAIKWAEKEVIPELRIGSNIRYNWPSVVAALENRKLHGRK